MPRLFPLAAAALLAAALPLTGAAAGPSERRLQIEIEYTREARFTGIEQGRSQLAQTLNLQLVLATDGVAMLNNPLDPEDSRRQLERAQRTQQKVQAALNKQGRAAPADVPSAAAMQAQAQALLARCGQDRDCLMREAQAMSAAQVAGGNPQVQARLQAYGNAVRACERQHAAGAAREACIAQARRQSGGADETDSDEGVETPYLHFSGLGACRMDAAMKIDERIDGSFGDVQGIVPFTTVTQAEGRDRETRLCHFVQAVLDTRNGRLWAVVLPALHGVPGTSVRTEKGRKPQHNDGLKLPQWHEAQDWLNARLLNLSAGGSDRLQRPLPGGQLDLKLRWRFVPL